LYALRLAVVRRISSEAIIEQGRDNLESWVRNTV
jgi:hypothetical protein